ncbi:DoxX protein [Mycobacteroides chelonae]|uniref:DoxX family protein n=1 Tax=Mycobacteroides chelonae TaxID=1774 RepID=UPI0008A8DC60|nr:DoxX family protein [Mycobacteroides chelonae]OHU69536.1 DoxX protein [Mycobacteroides chelonae]
MDIQRAGQIARWAVPTGARLVFGVIFLLEGTQKIFGWWSGSPTGSGHPEPFLNWPYWWAGVFELTLGVLLTVGLWTRVSAVLAAGMMAYGYFFEHLPVHWEPMQNGGAFAATFCWGFLLLALVADDTRLSLDRVRSRRAES